MKLPDDECSRVATSGWITELEKALFDNRIAGPEVGIVETLIGALRFERKRSAELALEVQRVTECLMVADADRIALAMDAADSDQPKQPEGAIFTSLEDIDDVLF